MLSCTDQIDRESLARGMTMIQFSLETPIELCERGFSSLSASEKLQAARYRNEERRRAFVMTRSALRTLLGWWLEVSPAAVSLTKDPSGKPVCSNQGRDRIFFNVSHSKQMAMIGISALGPVGVDVEWLDPAMQIHRLMRNYFTPRERDNWARIPSADRTVGFFKAWTRKEAIWKTYGDESVKRWDDIDVSLDCGSVREGDQPDVFRLQGGNPFCHGWCAENYAYCGAVHVLNGEKPEFIKLDGRLLQSLPRL